MLAESLRRVDIRPQSNFLNVDDASTSVTKGLNFNKNMSIATVFLDFETAIDTWHLGLLYKLSDLKFSVNLIKLTSSFLSQRNFRISAKSEISTPRDIQAGVPQGSVLSPTLYTHIYIYKLYAPNTWCLCLFADDICMCATDCKGVMLSESCGKVSVLLRRGMSAGT
jgi:hypothetical protein